MGFAATLIPLGQGVGGTELLRAGRAQPALVRFSRALGLPEALPDPWGIALRVPDAYGEGSHQDFLVVSSGLAGGVRHLPLPSRGFADRPYSSLLPYRIGGRLCLVAAVPQADRAGLTLADLRAGEDAPATFGLALAGITGPWRRVARVELGRRLPDGEVEALRFDPSNTGGGIELAGFINRLRPPAYRGSQDGRERAARRG